MEDQNPTFPPERWLNKADIAHHYSYTVRWVETQLPLGMPHRRIGGQVRFMLSQVDAWLSARYGEQVA